MDQMPLRRSCIALVLVSILPLASCATSSHVLTGTGRPPISPDEVSVLMWLFGVVLIALLTATVTSTQTVDRMQSVIRGPDDLPGKTIASVPGTPAGDYLTERGLPFTTVTYGPDGIRMLTRGEVQAAVFDRATLEYWAPRQGQGLVQVVGPIFRPQKYGIAVPVGSMLRRPINQALLEIYADGTYERIYSAWFSVAQ